jgi:uncharacterized membrane protein
MTAVAGGSMNRTLGHLIRILGLVIEMLGVWGVFNSTGAKESARLQLPGGNEIPLAWLAVGIGFVLWFTGTIVVYFSRPTRKSTPIRFNEPSAEPPARGSF